MNNPIVKMYLDYVNNYLTISVFAEHYLISNKLAKLLLDEGRELYAMECN